MIQGDNAQLPRRVQHRAGRGPSVEVEQRPAQALPDQIVVICDDKGNPPQFGDRPYDLRPENKRVMQMDDIHVSDPHQPRQQRRITETQCGGQAVNGYAGRIKLGWQRSGGCINRNLMPAPGKLQSVVVTNVSRAGHVGWKGSRYVRNSHPLSTP